MGVIVCKSATWGEIFTTIVGPEGGRAGARSGEGVRISMGSDFIVPVRGGTFKSEFNGAWPERFGCSCRVLVMIIASLRIIISLGELCTGAGAKAEAWTALFSSRLKACALFAGAGLPLTGPTEMLLCLWAKKLLKNLEWGTKASRKTTNSLVVPPMPILILTVAEASIISLVVLANLIQVAGAWSSMREKK